MPRRPPIDSPLDLRRKLWGRHVTDHNARLPGRVAETHVRAGSCFVTVDFDGGIRRELQVVLDQEDRPLTPHFIRLRNPLRPVRGESHWFRWSEPDDLDDRSDHEESPSGEIEVTVNVLTPERASPKRREAAAWYFAEVLATTIDDVLGQELWPDKSADEQSGQVETYCDVEQLDTSPQFAVSVKVQLFVEEQIALDLLAKLYLLLDSKHADYPELWQDVFAGRGVRDAVPSTFVVSGRIGDRPISQTKIPVRYYAPRLDKST
jgi:hypothetical protein